MPSRDSLNENYFAHPLLNCHDDVVTRESFANYRPFLREYTGPTLWNLDVLYDVGGTSCWIKCRYASTFIQQHGNYCMFMWFQNPAWTTNTFTGQGNSTVVVIWLANFWPWRCSCGVASASEATGKDFYVRTPICLTSGCITTTVWSVRTRIRTLLRVAGTEKHTWKM